jgi:plastocyanin
MFAVMIRNAILPALLSSVMVCAFSDCHSAALIVEITDARGRPVPEAVVVATAKDLASQPAAATPAVMDQIAKAFVPSVLVVRTGTPVIFPNSDTVAHQVYSFSATKRFELGLYRGHPHPPIVLDQAGLVVLGCNIHDNMVGYIYVTASPYFGKSDERGVWQMDSLPPGEYDVTIWSPRLPRDTAGAKRHVVLSDVAPSRVEYRLQQALRPGAEATPDARARDY